MEDNLIRILKEFEQLKGQFVITQSHRIERLIAIGDDKMDYYYITYDGRDLVWNTCVGRVIPLKGYLRDEDYNEFIRLAKLNDYDQPTIWGHNPEDYIEQKEGDNSKPITYKELTEQHKKELTNLELPNMFLTEICWDLN